jgi:hypothetical protein
MAPGSSPIPACRISAAALHRAVNAMARAWPAIAALIGKARLPAVCGRMAIHLQSRGGDRVKPLTGGLAARG